MISNFFRWHAFKTNVSKIRSEALPTVVFLAGLGLTAVGGLAWQRSINTDVNAEFQRGVRRVATEVAQRFRHPMHGLSGTRGLFAASQQVNRGEFRDYVESRDLTTDFPGVRGFGFIQRVMRADLATFIATERSDGAPRFAVSPIENTQQDDLLVIKFIEPAANNFGVSGLDVGSETHRRQAAQLAIDTGEPTITAAIKLVQDLRNIPGILMFVPVYAKGAPPTNVPERRAALVGLLYAPVVIAELLTDLTDLTDTATQRLAFELFDAAPEHPTSAHLFDTHPQLPAAGNGPEFSSRQSLTIGGRELTLLVSSTPGFEAAIDHASARLLCAAGALLSALLALLIRQQITGRCRAELRAQHMTAQLRLDETRWHDFSLSASDWFWETDAQHCFCYFSNNFEVVYGLAPSALLGQCRKDLLARNPRNTAANTRAHLAEMEAHLPFRNFEYQIEVRKGDTRWVAVSGQPHFNAQGDFEGYRGTGSNITESKNKKDELTQERRRLADIIKGTNVGTWEWQVQTGEVMFNARWAEIIGYTLAELAPISIATWVQFIHTDDLVHSNDLLKKHFSGALPFYEFEARMRHKDGHWVWVLDRGRVANWTPEGLPLLMSGTHQDITAQKEIQMSLLEARLQADAANLAKSQFLATMSHEIRTPMNGILGMAQLLLMTDLEDAKRREYVRIILSSGQSLLRLLNDILDLSKIEAGKFQLESTVFDPPQLMHDIESLFLGAAEAKNLYISTHWAGPAHQRYRTDAHRLRQMLSNLVGNAIKFTQQGSVHLEGTEIENDGQSALLEFSVTDTGMGVPADKLGLLFKPFSQADSSTTRKFGGSGLGLSIVRNIALVMQGDVGASSTVGEGSRFWFRIRADLVAPDEDARQTRRTVAAEPPLGSALRPGGRVLVAEDNEVNGMVITALLGQLGVPVSLVENGQMAVDAITLGDPLDLPDLILMDLNMPVMDGYTAAQHIRQWETAHQRPRLPIIALTADAFEEDRQHCLAVGMDDFLTKPIEFEALKAALNQWLVRA